MGWWTTKSSPQVAEPSGAGNIAGNDDQFQRSLDVPDEEPDPTQNRIIVPFSTLLVVSAMSLGFASGMMNGARHTALVYLAENAHKRPTTVQGWYFYNKTKYYRMILGGFRQGGSTSLRLAGWVAGWSLLDVLAEDARSYLAARSDGSFANSFESRVLQKLGHWSDGALAGFLTGLVGAISCTS